MTARVKTITRDAFRKLLAEHAIRPASIDDVEGTHHKRPLYRHPNTGQWYVAMKENDND